MTFQIHSKGDSMLPILMNGDIIEFTKSSYEELSVNDIVLIYHNGIFLTHRLIYKVKKYCITRGDNNAKSDTQVKPEQLIAKAIRFKRKGIWHNIQEMYISQSLTYLTEISKLIKLLRQNKIRHVFLKGVMISLRYESRIPQRIYADCDILIQREQSKQIEEVFNILGYRKINETSLKSISENESPEISFIKIIGKTPVVFDVHLEPVFLMTKLGGMNLLYSKDNRVKLGKILIDSSEKIKIGGLSYSLLDSSMQILYLALHVFHHNYTDIVRLKLIDAVIRKATKRKGMWKFFIKATNDFSLQNYIIPVLIQLKVYFTSPIPQSVFKSLQTDFFTRKVGEWAANSIDVFSQDNRIRAGIRRFILIFILSPEPYLKKILLFLYPGTIKSVFLVIYTKIYMIIKNRSVQRN
ncbi:MAG: nucleotidyltransferase family protein [Candidatus Taylorbacteria bacterium]|nr:nucleotidyltransferase family protein [Candidatus Taylorbacteria bacterium]